MSGNAIRDATRDEQRSAVRQMSELERVDACGHTVRVDGTCIDCGDKEDGR